MSENEITCCVAKEDKRERKSDFERALSLHFRMLRLIEVVIKHCERRNHLFARMLTIKSKNNIRFRRCKKKQSVVKHS